MHGVQWDCSEIPVTTLEFHFISYFYRSILPSSGLSTAPLKAPHAKQVYDRTLFEVCEISGSHGEEYEDYITFWDVSPCSLIVVERHFISLMMEAVCTSETCVYYNETAQYRRRL
jgi:hypothetical protein